MAHDCRPREQASGERACLVGAVAKVVERVEAAVNARDSDPEFAFVQLVRNDEVVGDRLTWPDGPEGVSCELCHQLLLIAVPNSVGVFRDDLGLLRVESQLA